MNCIGKFIVPNTMLSRNNIRVVGHKFPYSLDLNWPLIEIQRIVKDNREPEALLVSNRYVWRIVLLYSDT